MNYLGNRAVVTDYVHSELTDQAGTHRTLQDFRRTSPNWPRVLSVPPESFPEILGIQKTLSTAGDSDIKHLGEISTVVIADEQGIDVCLMDDRDGRALARTRGIATISTAMLVAEMVANEALPAKEGFEIYDLATPEGVGRPEFEAAVARFSS